MNEDNLFEILLEVSDKKMSCENALKEIKKLNNQERVVLVRDGENEGWTKRVFIKTLPNGKVVVWSCSESIEYSKDIFEAETWNFWKELEEPKELTPDQRIESLEKEVNELKEKVKGWSTITLGNPIDITYTGNPIKF